MKKTVTIEIETLRITRTERPEAMKWCGTCKTRTEFLTKSEAAELMDAMQISPTAIDPTALHFYHENGLTKVCLNSVLNGSSSGNYERLIKGNE